MLKRTRAGAHRLAEAATASRFWCGRAGRAVPVPVSARSLSRCPRNPGSKLVRGHLLMKLRSLLPRGGRDNPPRPLAAGPVDLSWLVKLI